MKKMTTLVLVVLMLAITACAETVRYTFGGEQIRIEIDDADYNVFAADMSISPATLERSRFEKDRIEMYMSFNSNELILTTAEGDVDNDFSIQIKVKRDKYGDEDMRNMSDAELGLMAVTLTNSFGVSDYTIEKVNGIPYIVFSCKIVSDYTRNYAAILDGDMIYIRAARTGEDLSEEELALLPVIVQSVYPNETA